MTPAMQFAADIERASRAAFANGVTNDEFFSTLAAFVGYAIGNHPRNGIEEIKEGIALFAADAIANGIDRHLQIAGTPKGSIQ